MIRRGVIAAIACGQIAGGQTRPATSAREARDAVRASTAPWRADLRNAIRAGVERYQSHAGTETSGAAPASDLAALYSADDYAPLWTDETVRPTPDAATAVALLTHAADEGLDPAEYAADTLTAQAGAIATRRGADPIEAAAFDTDLSFQTLRYMRELHVGRVDPRDLGLRISLPVHVPDFPGQLRIALADHRLVESIQGLEPSLPQYGALKRMLAAYRSLDTKGEPSPLIMPSAVVHPSDRYGDTAGLARRLTSLGDLPDAASLPVDSVLYGGAVVEGTKRFQARHGLEPDGVLGRLTIEALNVPVSARIRQIGLALERLRWLPEPDRERLIVINIPMFRLWAWDDIGSAPPALRMSVIVGRAVKTRTPIFSQEMRYIIFRPYWDVPISIVRKEILPALNRDPDYLGRENMEIVRGVGDQVATVAAAMDTLEELRKGTLRLRQRPGPMNSLGLVKFVFPNDENVYMHGTPAPQLFSQARRDFSHGCVRVEDPVALATWALQGQADWTPDAIRAAMNGDEPRRVDLAAPIRVLLFYTTAVVMSEDGALHFARDIYGEDARLEAALAQRAPRGNSSVAP